MQYVIEADGTYLGGWSDAVAAQAIVDAVAGRGIVATPPDSATRKWNGSAWIAATPTTDELLGQKIAAGIQIVSTGTPSLNGTYSLEDEEKQNITGILASIANGLGLPGGQSTIPLADMGGDPHSFTADALKALSKAMADYSYALSTTRSLLNAQQPAKWPAQPVSIA